MKSIFQVRTFLLEYARIWFDIDFFTKRTQEWWSTWIKDFHDKSLGFDGLWIDMNEPGNSSSLILMFLHTFLSII